MLPSRRYFSLSPASRQRLQFYNEFIKWWPSANNFQCCPRAFGPRATLEIIGFGSPLDKASLYRSKPPLGKATLVDIPWAPERLLLTIVACEAALIHQAKVHSCTVKCIVAWYVTLVFTQTTSSWRWTQLDQATMMSAARPGRHHCCLVKLSSSPATCRLCEYQCYVAATMHFTVQQGYLFVLFRLFGDN